MHHLLAIYIILTPWFFVSYAQKPNKQLKVSSTQYNIAQADGSVNVVAGRERD
jgi:hypothetical protein